MTCTNKSYIYLTASSCLKFLNSLQTLWNDEFQVALTVKLWFSKRTLHMSWPQSVPSSSAGQPPAWPCPHQTLCLHGLPPVSNTNKCIRHPQIQNHRTKWLWRPLLVFHFLQLSLFWAAQLHAVDLGSQWYRTSGRISHTLSGPRFSTAQLCQCLFPPVGSFALMEFWEQGDVIHF